MIEMTMGEIARACGGVLTGDPDICIKEITTDSRKAAAGVLFAALKGERADGHSFIPAAAKQGAAGVLCEEAPKETEIAYICVPSVMKALQEIAGTMLQKANIPVAGIGGSVGKTSTKEAVASVLSQKYSVLKTQGNFNNELGVPLTIFSLQPENNAAVIEMGIDNFGQMHTLASIVRPNICILTNIGDCHLENLGDRDGVLKAKSEMFDFVTKQDHIVLNGDDAHLKTLTEVNGVKPVFYGLSPENAFWADQIKDEGLAGERCVIHTPEGSFSVLVPMPGIHMVYNALAAAAAGMLSGLSLEQIKSGIEGQKAVSGRFFRIEENGIHIIDDCYNANPASMKASLSSLAKAGGRKVAVLGDMGELGNQEAELHAQVGTYLASLDINAVYCIGTLSAHISREAGKNPAIQTAQFPDAECFQKALPSLIRTGDTVLVKASHFMHFEKIVDALRRSTLEK